MEVIEMPTKNPRLNIVLEPDLYSLVSKIAHKRGLSLSLLARDLLVEALEIREDMYWQDIAEKREKTFSSKKALTHKETWK